MLCSLHVARSSPWLDGESNRSLAFKLAMGVARQRRRCSGEISVQDLIWCLRQSSGSHDEAERIVVILANVSYQRVLWNVIGGDPSCYKLMQFVVTVFAGGFDHKPTRDRTVKML